MAKHGDFAAVQIAHSRGTRRALEAARRGFEEGDLTVPSLPISEMQLARAISEFTGYPPNEASIATLEMRLNLNTDFVVSAASSPPVHAGGFF